MTACLLLFKIFSRWRSINISVAGHILEQESKYSTYTEPYYTQLSPTYNFRELDCKWVTVVQQKKQQEALLQWEKTLFSLITLMVVQLFYCVDSASTVHKICTRSVKNKGLKKGPIILITQLKNCNATIRKRGNHTLHPMIRFGSHHVQIKLHSML